MDDLIPYRRRGAVGPSFLQLDSEDLRGLTSRFGIGIGMPRKNGTCKKDSMEKHDHVIMFDGTGG